MERLKPLGRVLLLIITLVDGLAAEECRHLQQGQDAAVAQKRVDPKMVLRNRCTFRELNFRCGTVREREDLSSKCFARGCARLVTPDVHFSF